MQLNKSCTIVNALFETWITGTANVSYPLSYWFEADFSQELIESDKVNHEIPNKQQKVEASTPMSKRVTSHISHSTEGTDG